MEGSTEKWYIDLTKNDENGKSVDCWNREY
jgi:hypothetical protein